MTRTTEARLRLLIDTGLALASERSPDAIAHTALYAAQQLSGAAFGAFFLRRPGDDAANGSAVYQAYATNGDAPEWFRILPAAHWNSILGSVASGQASLRSGDVLRDPRLESMLPGEAARPASSITAGNPVRSFLAVPVRTRAGELFGVLLYGHPERDVFPAELEPLLATLAAQAAAALDNARVHETLSREIVLADIARADGRATGRRLAQALEAAQLGTWEWNAATGLIDFDERGAALFGIAPHTPISRDALRARIMHPDDLALAPEDLSEVLRHGGQYTTEYRIAAADGTQRWIATTGNLNQDERTDEITGLIGTVQDVTLRKTHEETLRTSEKLAATGRLAATIAHEINNPLEAVTNLIYLAKTDPVTPPPVARMLETADAELARVSQIAQQTLGFYRDTTRPVTIDLNDLLTAVVDLFQRKLAGKRLECHLELEPGLAVVGLQGEIRQVVSNLLVNAIDASPTTGAHIRIRGRRRRRNGESGVSVLISDQGTGIPHHVRQRLFTPFVTTKQSLGTGLGLWVTRGMVEKHGGSVSFRSRTDSPSGTVFRMYLPETADTRLFASQSSAVLQ